MGLSVFQSTALNGDGDITTIGGAEVEVRYDGGPNDDTLVALFDDRSGSSSKSNPFNADTDGFFRFYAPPVTVKITVTNTVSSESQTWRHIALGDLGFNQDDSNSSIATNVLTIPVNTSTVKLPSSVWDGTSNVTISQIVFENGAQPAAGYEFALIVPRSSEALVAGTLGNEVLFQDGALLKTDAYLNADFPCYPDAADKPDTDPVSLAAPYYRLIFRVDGYSGSDPIISLARLPDPTVVENDNGVTINSATGICRLHGDVLCDDISVADSKTRMRGTFNFPMQSSGSFYGSIANVSSTPAGVDERDQGGSRFPNRTASASSALVDIYYDASVTLGESITATVLIDTRWF